MTDRLRFSPVVLDLWLAGARLLDEDCTDDEELLEVDRQLYAQLGLRPWESSPLSVRSADPPDWMTDPRQQADWRRAWRLRQALERAAAAVPRRRRAAG